MTEKWTPGPWFIKSQNEFGEDVIGANDGDSDPWSVAIVCGMCGWPEDNSFANSRLITAAPDMAKALIACISASTPDERTAAIDAASAALAKARGEA